MPTDVTSITREHIESFVVHLLDTRSPATALNRYKAPTVFPVAYRSLPVDPKVAGFLSAPIS